MDDSQGEQDNGPSREAAISNHATGGPLRMTLGEAVGAEANDCPLALPQSPTNNSTFAGEAEKQIIRKQLDSPIVEPSYLALYRYADFWDCLLIGISAISAIAAGAVLPLLSVCDFYRVIRVG